MKVNRNKLEDVAQDIVQRSGVKGLSLRALAEEAGIESSCVHNHFSGKSDLVQALIERYTTTVFAILSDIASKQSTLREKLESFICIFDESSTDHLCLCGIMAAELELLGNRNIALLSSFFGDLEHWLGNLFELHRDDVKSSLPPNHLAKVMISSLEGAMLLDRIAGDSKCMDAQKELLLSMV